MEKIWVLTNQSLPLISAIDARALSFRQILFGHLRIPVAHLQYFLNSSIFPKTIFNFSKSHLQLFPKPSSTFPKVIFNFSQSHLQLFFEIHLQLVMIVGEHPNSVFKYYQSKKIIDQRTYIAVCSLQSTTKVSPK